MLIKDVNGKEFNVELQDFMHFTTDADIEKGRGFNLADSDNVKNEISVKILDAEGNEVDVKTLLDAKQSDKPISCIDVTFESTHSGRNRNYSVYHSDSMEKDMETWMVPFARPFIKNHDTSAEPLGRVKNYSFSRSDFNPDRDAINVTYRITDMDAIPKFLDGRYKTMSIGGHVKSITCGICGKSILKDNKVKFCGHWKGETYNNQVCYWNCRDIEYVEGSVVNTPADDWAMVKTIVINPQDSENQDANTKKSAEDGKDIDNMPGSVLDNIDTLINPNPPAEDTVIVNDNNNVDLPAVVEDDDTDAKITEMQDTITNLQNQLEDMTEKHTQKETELTALNDKLNSLETDFTALKDQLVSMAKFNKELLAQRVIDFMTFNSEITDEEVEAKKEELMTKTAVELNDIELSIKTKDTTIITAAANPGLANLEDGVSVVDDNKIENKNEVITLTLKDLENTIVDTLTRSNGYKKEEF